MNDSHDWLRDHLLSILKQVLTERVVIAVPQGVAVLNPNGQHILIRIDDAKLSVRDT